MNYWLCTLQSSEEVQKAKVSIWSPETAEHTQRTVAQHLWRPGARRDQRVETPVQETEKNSSIASVMAITISVTQTALWQTLGLEQS